MTTLNLRMAAMAALTLLTACGGVDRTEPTRPEPMPGEIVEGSKQIDVSGLVTLDDGVAKLNLDVAVDGAYAKDAKVTVGGHELAFDEDHHGYYAELPFKALPAGSELEVEVTHGEARHTRSLMVPGAFEVEAPTSVVVGSDYSVSWSRSAGANGFRVYLEPTDAFIRGGEVGALVHQYTFDQLQTVGPARLRVIAISQNLFEGNERAKVEVIRIDRRIVSVVEEPVVEPDQQLALSGRVTLLNGYAVVNLDVQVDGEWVNDAQVRVAGYEVAFDAYHFGYYAEIPLQDLPASDLLRVEVNHGEVTHTRDLVVPGAFTVDAPESVTVGTDFAIGWTESTDASQYRVSLKPQGAFERGGQLAPSVFEYTFNGLDSAGAATLDVIAVALNDAGEQAKVEVLRINRRTLSVEEQSTPVPALQIDVSGRGTISEQHSELVVRVLVNGQPVTNAELYLDGSGPRLRTPPATTSPWSRRTAASWRHRPLA